MDNEIQPITTLPFVNDHTTPTPNALKNKSNKSKVFIILFVVILLGVTGYVGYVYGTKNNSVSPQGSITKNAKKLVTVSPVTFHTVNYGITKLAFPDNYQAIASYSGTDTFRSLFGDNNGNFIYDGGHWNIGNPENSDIGGNHAGYIGIMGIAPDWYSRDGFATYGGTNGDSYTSGMSPTVVNGYDFSTAKNKNESLNKLISDTKICSKDSTKGFTLSGIFYVCYKPYMMKQSYAAYSPQIEISGYASIKNIPYVMFGYISIRSGLDNYSAEALNKAGDDFKAGKIPGPTQKNIDAFVDAFKNSMVTY